MILNLRLFLLFFVSSCLSVWAADAPQWGVDQGRNRISHEKNLPATFEPGKKDPTDDRILDAGSNVRWVARIGSRTYTPPVVAEGRVLIGTNNDALFQPEFEGDRGVMLCLDAKSGRFLWQYSAEKIPEIKFFDVEQIGITSTPTVVDGRVYFVDNRGEVCALELATGKPIWKLDLISTFGVRQHDTNNCTIIVHGGLLYLGTANGLDDKHAEMERPAAPTFVVLDAETGRPLARDADWLRTNISHGQWSCPALGEVRKADGTRVWTVFYGTGNGIIHAVPTLNRNELLRQVPEASAIGTYGEKLPKIEPAWTFDGNGPEVQDEVKPFQGGRGSKSFTCLPPLVFHDNRLYVMFCFDGFNGGTPRKTFLAALDPSLPDDVPKASRLLWKTPNIEKGAIAPQCVSDGLLYFGDRGGGLHCLDADSGETVWKLDLKGDHWAGPMVADGKVYVGTNRRMLYVLRAGREPAVLSEIEMPDAMFAGAVAADETLFVPMNGFLYSVTLEARKSESSNNSRNEGGTPP